jgi:hypothetical protein
MTTAIRKTYRKDNLAEDAQGYFRFVGGRRFRFGRDERRGKQAVPRLETLYERAGSDWDTDAVRSLASAIARGELDYRLGAGGQPVLHHRQPM